MNHSLSVFTSLPNSSPTATPSPSPNSIGLSNRTVALLRHIRQEAEVKKASQACISYEQYLQQYGRILDDFAGSTISRTDVQKFVLEHGIPDEDIKIFGNQSIRSRIWRVLLELNDITTTSYDDYVVIALESPTPAIESKIKDDGFRTFKGNDAFWNNVDEDLICRVLRATSRDVGYVQGMNVLLGPFLRIMPEWESYLCFRELVINHIPAYVSKNLDGVHKGISLVRRCLFALDPQLITFILSKIPDLTIFSVRYVLTMMANIQPLEEVLKIWDAIFCVGTHMSIVIYCAHLISCRETIMSENTANKIMRVIEGSTLDSLVVIPLALDLTQFIGEDLMREIQLHCKQMGRS